MSRVATQDSRGIIALHEFYDAATASNYPQPPTALIVIMLRVVEKCTRRVETHGALSTKKITDTTEK